MSYSNENYSSSHPRRVRLRPAGLYSLRSPSHASLCLGPPGDDPSRKQLVTIWLQSLFAIGTVSAGKNGLKEPISADARSLLSTVSGGAMPEVHVFFGIRNKSNPEPEKQQIHAAVVRHAGPDHQLSDGSYRYGIDVASLSFNREAKVLTLNTAEDDESLSQRLLQPLSNALGRRCLPYKDILNFSIAGRDIMTKGGERPLIYKIV